MICISVMNNINFESENCIDHYLVMSVPAAWRVNKAILFQS